MIEHSRRRGANQPPDNANYHKNLAESYDAYSGLPLRERQARSVAEALIQLPVYLFTDERLVGMVYHLGEGVKSPNPFDYWGPAAERVKNELPENRQLVEMGTFFGDGAAPGHISWRWDWILKKGAAGLLSEHRRALENAKDERAADFHRGAAILLEAVLRWNDRHVEAIEKALSDADGSERARLAEMLEICRRVPAYPARTFHEAIQSFYFQHLVVMRENPYGGNGPGRLDYFLWPYLERDLASGTCSLEDARELIDELFIRIHERILEADGWVEAISVGGSNPDGTSAVNPLSYMMVERIIALDQVHPSIYMRIPADPPPEYVELAARYMIEGKNRAQILNDRRITAAMQNGGMPYEDAAMYACGGCMEISPQGLNSDMLFSTVHNVAKVAELVLTGGECLRTGRRLSGVSLKSLTKYGSFEDLFSAFEKELRRELGILFRRLDFYNESMAANRPAYLISSMVQDCFARGREMNDGGARYNDYGIAPLGIQNAGDALYAVKRAVFDDGFCSAEELLSAMRSDFQGQESLRLRLRALPKFGQQDRDADAMTDRVLKSLCGIYADYRTRFGGRVKPMIFSFVWAPGAGAALGATADGRRAGEPLAQGLTPQNCAMTEGITAALGSHAGLSLERVTGGSTGMWDMDPAWATRETVGAVIKGFLALGGQIFQGNTTDVAELIEARNRPQDFPNLIVRVGGFSARFVTLDAALQDEIIRRRRHAK